MWRRRVALAAAGAVACAPCAAPAAVAHTHLDASVPADGARLQRPPDAVELTFDDPVEARLSAATLIGPDGRRARLSLRTAPAPGRLLFELPADMPAGEAIVAYRALSTDGHPAAGAIVFASATSARAAARAAAASRAAIARERAATGPQVAARVLAAARGLQYVAIAIVLGGSAFLVLAWGPAVAGNRRREHRSLLLQLARRWRRLAAVAIALGAASAAVAFAAQTAVADGARSALTFDGGSVVMTTRAGAAWLLALCAWLTAATVLHATARQPDHARALLALALPLAVLTVVPAASGHAGRDATLVTANVVHVCAVSTWLGGLVALLLVTRTIDARGPSPAERRLLDELVSRFSVVALAAIATLAATGAVQGALLLSGPGELLATGYGRLLDVKIGLTLVVLALGARQRRAIARRPHSFAGAGVLVGTARIELLLGLLVLATTALLAGEASSG